MPKTAHQISDQYRIPLKKIRMMVLAGDLFVAAESFSDFDKLVFALKKANPLSTRQLCHLLRTPGDLKKLGKYRDYAELQLESLGNVKADMLRSETKPHNLIVNCAIGDAPSIDRFAEWLSSVIPERGCNYTFLAVRACVNVEENFYEIALNHISKAIRRARGAPALDGMSAVEGNGTKFFKRKFDL